VHRPVAGLLPTVILRKLTKRTTFSSYFRNPGMDRRGPAGTLTVACCRARICAIETFSAFRVAVLRAVATGCGVAALALTSTACIASHSGGPPAPLTSSVSASQPGASSAQVSSQTPGQGGESSLAQASPSGPSAVAGSGSTNPTPLPSASSSNALPTPGPTGPLRIFADVTIKGAFASAETGLTLAQGPDGALFVAGPVASPQIIWVVDGVRPAGIAEHVKGPVTALAADTANLYVGVGQSVTAYSRTTGNVVRTWNTGLPGTLTQLVVAGTRVWGLSTQSDDNSAGAPDGLIELDPASSSPVRSVTGFADTFSIAAGPSGVYYVTKQSNELVEQTNAGATITAPTNQQVNLQLSGPSAIQAVAVLGGQVILQHDAGQGLDAQLNTYDATTLVGPTAQTNFSADEPLALTSSGLFVVGNSDTGVCAPGQTTCVRRFSLPTENVGQGDPLALPDDMIASAVTGPYPTVVLARGSDLHVLRIS
jgi:hypothetical protein